MSKRLYRPEKNRKAKKEKLKLVDRLEIFCITAAAVALVCWTGWSIKETVMPKDDSEIYDITVSDDGSVITTDDGYEVSTTVVGDEEDTTSDITSSDVTDAAEDTEEDTSTQELTTLESTVDDTDNVVEG